MKNLIKISILILSLSFFNCELEDICNCQKSSYNVGIEFYENEKGEIKSNHFKNFISSESVLCQKETNGTVKNGILTEIKCN